MGTTDAVLRLVMMGTGPFAVPMFQSLLQSRHKVLALVTRPDRPAHRREKTPVNPMRETARQHGLEVFEPDSVNSSEAQAWLKKHSADLFVVCDYGQILSQQTLALARSGGINLHASILPKYRGAAPINWAIYHGEAETGVTVIHMTPQLDAGPALVQLRTEIGPSETAPELEMRLAALGVGAVVSALELLAKGESASGIVQDPNLVTKAPRLKKDDGLVDWSRSATDVFNQVRAFQPWPKTYAFWKRPQSQPVRLILEHVEPLQTAISPIDTTATAPGTIVCAEGDNLVVTCGSGLLKIDSLQPAGKRSMSAAEFLRGHPLGAGDQFG